ncbi:formate dehydrogenase accessory sulfurtransferase FdhD [Notoacmeibacter ruber]|uniref:Sulfur carrier protein FdhD n=1 Tax=Notoacmeibacter ruber TaxID=2670375 RepID=A0A3L7JEW8_9HYPH|nr:formate dehydrogenase accessory sulfurtransferase FdhD [Notoacmeibacter ruber]RLQ89203.1 formate dehydrogenase accessory sulfurtransferase FdhD [Notoacmeibacter ruber]
MDSWRKIRSIARHTGNTAAERERQLPEEVAIALSCNGSTQAVMMGTPADLRDFATGFLMTEGIAQPDEIESIEPVETELGIDLQIRVTEEAASRLAIRRRSMAGPVGCGLCGIESLEAAMHVPPLIPRNAACRLTPGDVSRAMAQLPTFQPLHDATRAVHGAAFFDPRQGIILAREDVGRHNALDKLIGAMVLSGTDRTGGAIVITSRVSIDMVQKVLRCGTPILIATSSPTASALDLAKRNGLTVVALARGDQFEIFTHPHRIDPSQADNEGPSHAVR